MNENMDAGGSCSVEWACKEPTVGVVDDTVLSRRKLNPVGDVASVLVELLSNTTGAWT